MNTSSDDIQPPSSTSNVNSNFTPKQLDLGLVINNPPDSMIQKESIEGPLESQRDYQDRREETLDDDERVHAPRGKGQPQVKCNLVENSDLNRGRDDSSHITSLDSSSSDDEYEDRNRSSSDRYRNEHRDSGDGGRKSSSNRNSGGGGDSDSGSDTNTRRRVYMKMRSFCQKNGYDFPSHLHQDSPLSELKAHLALIKSEKVMENSVEMCKKVLVGIVSVFEFTNEKFDPLGLKLDGWSEQVQSEGDQYDEVFEELYEKHQDKLDMPPEVKLMMLIAGSGVQYHVQNKAASGMMRSKTNYSNTPSQGNQQQQQQQRQTVVPDPRSDDDPDIQELIRSMDTGASRYSDTESQNSIGTTSSAIRSKRSKSSVSIDVL